MARQIPSPFGPWNGSGITWTELFNGHAWEIKRGEDYDLATSTVAAHIRAEYQRLYGGLNIKEDGDTIRVERVVGVLEAKATGSGESGWIGEGRAIVDPTAHPIPYGSPRPA